MSRPVADVLAEVLVDHRRARTDVRWDRTELDWIHWYRCSCGTEVTSTDATPLWWEEHVGAALADATTDTAAPSYEEGYRAGMDDAAVPEIAALFADDDTTAPVVERILARRVSVDRAKVEAVEALVDEWGERVEYYRGTGNYQAMAGVTRELRAALGAPSATERGGKITHG